MRLIVNADDFGMNENVTRAILASFKRGFVNQTTLMVNMPWAEKAVELAKEEGVFDRIGLHLNLTLGRPLTAAMARHPLFCDERGEFDKRFARNGHLLRGYSGEVASLIREEVEAQIVRYRDFGLPLLHLDSHHHVHHRLPLARIVLPIMARHGFKTTRPPCSIGFRGIGARLRGARNLLFKRLAKKWGIGCVDEFGSPEAFAADAATLKGSASVELMVHPWKDGGGRLVNIARYDDLDNPLGGPLLEETARQVKEALCAIG